MRTIKPIKLYQFHELSPKAQAKAIEAEREAQLPNIREMIEALFEQELARVGASLENLTIDWNSGKVMADVTATSNPEIVEQVLAEITLIAQGELPRLLSDTYMQANIEADELEFLATGAVWVYREEGL